MGSRDNASPETTGPNTTKKHSRACEDTRIIVARMRRRAGEALNTRCHSLRSFAYERKRFTTVETYHKPTDNRPNKKTALILQRNICISRQLRLLQPFCVLRFGSLFCKRVFAHLTPFCTYWLGTRPKLMSVLLFKAV